MHDQGTTTNAGSLMAAVVALGLLAGLVACGADGDASPPPPAGAIATTTTTAPSTTTTTTTTTAPEPPARIQVHALTRDGTDEITWQARDHAGVRGIANPGTTGGNLREVAVREGTPPAIDQQSCATWWGPVFLDAQPGLALRIRHTPSGGTQAITVTQNVWSAARGNFNVHLADSEAAKPMFRLGGAPIPALRAADFFLATPPWRMCARAQGARLTVKVWSTTETPREPSWRDPHHAFTIELPEEWVYAGQPGLYLGHLLAGLESTYTDWTTWPR